MKAFFTPLVLLSCLQVTAQEKIDTDRPDQTESAVLVPMKYFQGEFGLNKENYEDDNYALVHPTFLLKYGLSKRFELRLESAFSTEYLHYIPSTKKITRLEPAEIGSKISLFEEKGLLPKTSLIAHLGLPFAASNPDKEQNLFPSYRFTFQHTISKTVGLGYNIGSEWDGYEDRTIWLYTFSPNFNIGERWYGYVELFGFKEEKWQHAVDGGIAYYISKDTKLDLSGGFGLGNNPLKNYIALGFSFRIPFNEKYRLGAK
jgi:hypothetical protein